jgi:hypothetical protein
LIVARPRDGAPTVLEANAVIVWHVMDDWTTTGEIDRRLADAFPDVAGHERERARSEILRTLRADDLIELVGSR